MMFRTIFILCFPFNKTEALYHSKQVCSFQMARAFEYKIAIRGALSLYFTNVFE